MTFEKSRERYEFTLTGTTPQIFHAATGIWVLFARDRPRVKLYSLSKHLGNSPTRRNPFFNRSVTDIRREQLKRTNICYSLFVTCRQENLEKRTCTRFDLTEGRNQRNSTKLHASHAKVVSKTKTVSLNLKCGSNWKRYVTLRTICIEWFRFPAENTEVVNAKFRTRSPS